MVSDLALNCSKEELEQKCEYTTIFLGRQESKFGGLEELTLHSASLDLDIFFFGREEQQRPAASISNYRVNSGFLWAGTGTDNTTGCCRESSWRALFCWSSRIGNKRFWTWTGVFQNFSISRRTGIYFRNPFETQTGRSKRQRRTTGTVRFFSKKPFTLIFRETAETAAWNKQQLDDKKALIRWVLSGAEKPSTCDEARFIVRYNETNSDYCLWNVRSKERKDEVKCW